MSKARNLADVISGAYDVPAEALDNAPAPTLSTLGIANHDNIAVDSSGRVTMLYQPGVKVCIDTNGELSGVTGTTTGTTILPFNSIASTGHNIGSAYNTSTHRFTCPVDGRYLVILSVNVIGDNILFVRVNGTDAFAGEFRSNPNGVWEHDEISAILDIGVNDYIEAWSATNGDRKYNGGAGGSKWDTLSIHLIG